MQVEELNEPKLFEENVTVPVGVVTVPWLVSVIVAVHVVGALTATEDGAQVTDVDVVRVVTVNGKSVAVLLE